MAQTPRRSRRGGRAARQQNRQNAAAAPFITRNIPCYEILNTEGLEIIEANAETILFETGIEFRGDTQVLDLWRQAGADVQGERVRVPKGLARRLCALAPSEFTQCARNRARNVRIGGKATVFAPVYGSPFVHDLDKGRRYGTIEDFHNFTKLAYLSPHLHHSGGTLCEPVDIDIATRHLDMVYSHIRYSDKAFMGSVTSGQNAQDSLAMARIVFGEEFTANNTVLLSLINANSPLVYDATMLGALKAYAGAGQACIISPFILAGAMSPVTPAAVLAQLLAEAMAGIALAQLIRPGAPVIFGAFVSSISMQSGAPTFGTPESSMLIMGAAQLARRLNVPFRSGGSFCAAKLPDAQAAAESANSLMSTLLSGVNFVLHAAGWMEGGLVSSFEKFVMDTDQLGMMHVLAKGIAMDEEAQAMDAIREVGPGGHFLGCAHTQSHFKTAFYNSAMADNNSFEQWQAEGSRDAMTRANALWKKQLAEYEAPPLDPIIDEALADFMARRRSEITNSDSGSNG